MHELSGRDTISEDLDRSCADEPIHIIGTVQPHGFVLVVDVHTARIVQVSSGVARHWKPVGHASHLVGEDISQWVRGFPGAPQTLLESLPLSDPVTLHLRLHDGRPPAGPASGTPAAAAFECVGHRVGRLAILEWQPLGPGGNGAGVEPPSIGDLTSALTGLRSGKALQAFFDDCVQEIARLSGFDRVMLYRFLPDWTGEVIAEAASGDLGTRFQGLRFPATDIPAQARALFAQSRIRVLADVKAAPDTLVPPLLPGGEPLDQSHCLLRGLSDVHRSYLGNMGVRATMSLSIVCDGRLWGLIACHHYEPRIPPHHIRSALRQVCELVAEVSAMRIETLAQLATVQAAVRLDKLLVDFHQAVLQEVDPESVLKRMLPDLLSMFQASALCMRVGSLNFVGGSTQGGSQAPEILQEIAGLFGPEPPVSAVVQLSRMLTPDGVALLTLPAAAGLLAVEQTEETTEFCAFVRPEVVQEVNWAGAPSKETVVEAHGRIRLEPRRSFERWRQDIAGTARAWSVAEVDACTRLLRILGDASRRQLHKTLEHELRWRAHHDHLTGLINRRSIEESLDQRLGARRFDSAVMLIDLDHFKRINDTHGHAAGDRLLKELSDRLSLVVRPDDLLSRVGGDEFLLLADLPLPDHAVALSIGARLHKVMEEPFMVEGRPVRLGLSVGISIPPEHGTNATDLMRRADLALFRAKKSGRGTTTIFDANLEEGLLGAYEIERDLRDALARGQLSLVFQPEVNLDSGRVVALECLARWDSPTRGPIGPAEFIPVAERSNLIIEIGQWAVRTAVATQARWRSQGHAIVPMAVNVSMAELASGNLVDTISRTLQEFQMPPACLSVELTESVIMKDLRVATQVLTGLQQLGITTALDDFGTGYSSLSYLRQLPLACLKVDQSFTADLTRDANARGLTKAIIRMAVALKMTTIAEGIETQGQLQWLRAHKCNIGQGFLFSHPVTADLVTATIERVEAAGWNRPH